MIPYRYLVLLIAILIAGPAIAHPHIFIDARAVVVFDGTGAISAIRHSWTFDEAFSAWTVQGLDTDGDGRTSPAELQEFADENLQGLAQYGFYTHAGEGEATVAFEADGAPRMEYAGGRTTLSFAVRPEAPYRIRETLELAINDPEYYAALTFPTEGGVALENAPAGCGTRMAPPRELAPELADQLYALPPEVTELPPDLAAALRGVQGAILISCGATAAVPGTALEAVNAVAETNANPFGGPPAEPGLGLPRTGAFLWLAEQQRAFYAALTGALATLRSDQSGLMLLCALSFLYGVLHAAGPGHGKIVIGSYMLATESELRRGVTLSFLSAMLQSLVAVALVSVAALLLNLSSAAMGAAAEWIGVASYGLVAALGLWLVLRKLFGSGHRHDHGASMAARARAHLHDHPDHDNHDHTGHDHAGPEHPRAPRHNHAHAITPNEVRGSFAEQLGVVLAVGARPCSGALVVLVFALSQGMFPAGIAAVFMMGLGTALTVAALALLAVGAKGAALRLTGGDGVVAASAVWWLELAGAIAVLGFGTVLLLASL